jgi:hypothetical protein
MYEKIKFNERCTRKSHKIRGNGNEMGEDISAVLAPLI